MNFISKRMQRNSTLLGIGTLLVAQFVAAKALPREPYPALLLPGGATTIEHGTGLGSKGYRLYAMLDDGSTVRVDHHALLADIPQTYRRRVLARLFETHFQVLDAEGQQWFRQRLARIGVEHAGGLMIRQVWLTGTDATPNEATLAESFVAWTPLPDPE